MSTDYVPGAVAAFLSSSTDTPSISAPDKKLKAKQSALLALFNRPTPQTSTEPEKSPKKKKIKTKSDDANSRKRSMSDSEGTKSPKGVKSAKKKQKKSAETIKVESVSPEKKSGQKKNKKKRKSSEPNSDAPASPRKKVKQDSNGTPKTSNGENTTEQKSKTEKKPTNRVLQRENKKKKKNPEKHARTVFVGNLPTSAGKHSLTKFFKKYGEVESVRFRSAAPANLKLPKKAIMNLKAFHEERHTMNGYVVFKEKQAAKDALSGNGEVLAGNHIRVDLAKNAKKVDNKRSVFVGNLPFDAEEEALRQHFEDCGNIENVRIIRENKTGLGKGFGYIRFADKDGVSLALKLHSTLFQKRTLRVLRAEDQTKKKGDSGKVGKAGSQDTKTTPAEEKTKKKFSRNMPSNVTSKDFQGVKAKSMEKIKKKQKQKKKLKKQKEAGKGLNKAKTFKKKNHGGAARGRLAKKERKSNARKI